MTRRDGPAPPEHMGELTGAARALRRTGLWNVIVVVVLVGGIALSAAAAAAWHDYVQDEARATFATNSFSLSAAVSTALRRDIDFVASQKAGVLAVPDLSNRELAVWFESVDVKSRFPGGAGFAFVQRVLPEQLPAFGAEVVADPPVNEPVASPYSVLPAGQRSQYCLQRFGIATSAAARPIPANFDFCSSTIPPDNGPSPIPRLLAQATDTGQSTVLAAGKIAQTSGIATLFVTFTPVYMTRSTPVSVAVRRAELRGWIVATFSGTQLLGSNLAAAHGLDVSVLFDEPSSGRTTIASSGPVLSGALYTREIPFHANGTWIVRIVGSARSKATVQAVIVGLLGVALTFLLFLFFFLLTRSRTLALRMVEKRTRQLRHQALHDPLTDLPNRALILDRAEQMLLRARRNPLMIGALFIDLDEFKDVNDTYGHEVGDQLLKAVGTRLSGSLRASDSVGRLGGDEFVVLVEGELGGDGPEVVARQLLDLFTQPFAIESDGVESLRISASIGVALGPRSGAADLLRDADVALYVAKARGKHGYVVFRSQMKSFLSDRLGLEHDPRADTATEEEPTGEAAGPLFGPTDDRDDGVVSGSRTQEATSPGRGGPFV